MLTGIDFAQLSPASRLTLAEVVRPMVQEDLDESGVAKLLGVERRTVVARLALLADELAPLLPFELLGRWACAPSNTASAGNADQRGPGGRWRCASSSRRAGT